MPAVLHIVSPDTPCEMIAQAALLVGGESAAVSITSPVANWPADATIGIAPAPIKPRQVPALASGFDLVHAWSLSAAIAAAAHGNCPIVLSLPSCGNDHASKAAIAGVLQGKWHLTVPTEASRSNVANRAGIAKAVSVLPPAVIPPSDHEDRRLSARKKLGIGDNEILIVSPSPMIPCAGHKDAAWGFALLIRVMGNLRITFPQSGPCRKSVRKFLAASGSVDEVTFPEVPLPLEDTLCAADIAAFTHTDECCIYSMAASMAAKVPMVVSNLPHINEYATNEQNALLASTGDVREIAADMLRLIDQSDLAGSLGRNAAQLAGEIFSPQSAKNALSQIYGAMRR